MKFGIWTGWRWDESTQMYGPADEYKEAVERIRRLEVAYGYQNLAVRPYGLRGYRIRWEDGEDFADTPFQLAMKLGGLRFKRQLVVTTVWSKKR